MFFCNFSESFIKNRGYYFLFFNSLHPKTYQHTILKGSNDINWDNIGDFYANIEHVFVYYDNFGNRHPE